MPAKLLAGIDIYDATYGSDRSLHLGDAPFHRYDLTQQTVATYFMETIAVRSDTDVAFGARIQRNETTARDRFDANAPGAAFAFPSMQGVPFNRIESRYAWHVGIDHRVNEHFALFARAAHSIRLPTVDERVGLGDPTNFALRTQTSQDIEGGIRAKFGPVTVQSSLYRMWLRDEI